MRDRDGLVARIRHLRSVSAARDAAPPTVGDPEVSQARGLEVRVAHMEQLLEGFQDSVHRETERQNERISDLEARTQPAALNVALSKDARERGL
jgi:hypothetical protein